jgi:FkbM family methyltransferase
MTTPLQRVASAAVCAYIRHSPVRAGKWRLMRWASSFLVAELGPGTYVRVSDPEDSVQAAIVRKGLLEPQEVRLFLSLLGPGMTVFDVGANLGMYTLLAARRVGLAGRLHAFEPTPAVAERLEGNVRLNALPNVVVNRTAVSDTAGVATFYLGAASDRNTLGPGGGTPTSVATVTLDDYVTSHGLGGVDVLKMDVEGAEVMALRGARRLLEGPGAPVLLVEFNEAALRRAGAGVAELRGLLEGHGYRCSTLGSHAGENCFNVLACKGWHRDRFPALRARELTPLP